MPNSPFRVAFWALCLSFAMLVTLSIINPQNMRTGLYAKSERIAPIPDWVTVEKSYSPDPIEYAEPTLAPAYENGPTHIAKLEPVAEVKEFSAPSPKPVMVAAASGDFHRDVGGLYPISEPQPTEAIPPAPSEIPVPVADAEPAKAILVPEPRFPAFPEDDAPTVADSKVEDAESAYTTTLLEKMAAIQDELVALRTDQTSTPALSVVTVEEEPNYTVASGEGSGRWSFTFDNTDLPQAFRVLGDHLGWHVVVGQDVAGSVTADFIESDPEQAFAVLVKSHNCTISRRGDYILIEKRSLPR